MLAELKNLLPQQDNEISRVEILLDAAREEQSAAWRVHGECALDGLTSGVSDKKTAERLERATREVEKLESALQAAKSRQVEREAREVAKHHEDAKRAARAALRDLCKRGALVEQCMLDLQGALGNYIEAESAVLKATEDSSIRNALSTARGQFRFSLAARLPGMGLVSNPLAAREAAPWPQFLPNESMVK